MRKRNVKATAMLILTSGCLFQFGCLGTWFNQILRNIPGQIAAEFFLDNDLVFDLFEDGGIGSGILDPVL